MKIIKRSLILILATAIGSLTIPATQAAPSRKAVTGRTVVVLSPDFIAAFKALQLNALPVSPSFGASVNKSTPLQLAPKFRSVTFPIDGGVLDFKNAAGEIIHSGGLSIRGGGKIVSLTEFIIDTTTEQPVLTGLVTINGDLAGRVPLFNIQLPALSLPLRTNSVVIRGNSLTLTTEAAGALNAVFSVTAFKAGFTIGSATVVGTFGPGL